MDYVMQPRKGIRQAAVAALIAGIAASSASVAAGSHHSVFDQLKERNQKAAEKSREIQREVEERESTSYGDSTKPLNRSPGPAAINPKKMACDEIGGAWNAQTQSCGQDRAGYCESIGGAWSADTQTCQR